MSLSFADHIWLAIALVWLLGAPIWWFAFERSAPRFDSREDRIVRSTLWPLMVLVVVTLWVAFRGWPLLILLAVIATLFLATTGRLPT